MATPDKQRWDRKRLVFSRDVWISEKRGVSRARDAKTGRLLSEGTGTIRSKTAAFGGRFKK